MMEVERHDASWHFRIGPLGKAVGSLIVVLISGLMTWQALTLVTLSKQQAVMTYQLKQMAISADRRSDQIPQLQQRQAEHEVRINALEQAVHELRQVRGLK